MDDRIERLRSMGCHTTEALARMVDDEEFYIECLREALTNPGFAGLKKSIDQGDAAAGFDCAHALKGVLGNVGLTPMFDKVSEIVESLRTGNSAGLAEKLAELLEMKQKFMEMIL